MPEGRVNFVVTADEAKALKAFQALENKEAALSNKQQDLAKKEIALSDEVFRKRLQNAQNISEKDRQQMELRLAQREKMKRLEEEYGDREKNSILDRLGPLGHLAAGYLSVHAAIEVAREALAEFHKERDEGARAAEKADLGLGELAQVATSAEDLKHLKEQAYASMREEGLTVEEAGKLQFNLRSAGKDQYREMYASLKGLANPAEMFNAVTTLQGAMGLKETGGDKQILDKLFLTSTFTKANANQLASAAASSGKQASLIGTSDEELLAALAVTTRGEATADEAATQIASFSAAVAQDKRLGGEKGLLDAVERIRKMNPSNQRLYKLLGRKEAVKGYVAMVNNLDEIRRIQGENQAADANAAAGGTGFTDERIGWYRGAFAEQRGARIARTENELAKEEAFGAQQLRAETTVTKANTRSIERRDDPLVRTAQSSWLGALAWMGASPETLKMAEERYQNSPFNMVNRSRRVEVVVHDAPQNINRRELHGE